MSYAAGVLRRTVRRLLVTQALLVLAAGLVYLALAGVFEMVSTLYGGVSAMAGALIAAWRIARAGEAAGQNQRQGELEIYMGAAMRFVATLALMAIGMALLRLDPLAIIIGFAAAQLGYMFTSVQTAEKISKE